MATAPSLRTTAPVTHSIHVAKASLKPTEKTKADHVFVQWLKGSTDPWKYGYVSHDWYTKAGGTSPTYAAVAAVSKALKLGISAFVEGPKKIQDAVRTFFKFKKKEESAAKAGLKALEIISPAHDAAHLMNKKVFTLSDGAMKAFGGANFGALGISMVNSSYEATQEIQEERKNIASAKTEDDKALAKEKIKNALLKLAKAISYVALAVIGLAWTFGIITMTPVVSILMLAASTSALIWSTTQYFHKNIAFTPDGNALAPKAVKA